MGRVWEGTFLPLLQLQLLTHLSRPDHPRTHILDHAHGLLDKLAIGRELALADIQIVLKTDENISAGEDGLRRIRELVAPDR